jgi:phosphate transport system permease protein
VTAVTLRPSRRRAADRSFTLVTLGCGLSVLVVLLLIAVSTTGQALAAFRHQGISFLTSNDWNPPAGRFGALAFVYGTVVVSAVALVIAVPVSIGIALFLTEVAPRPLRRPVSYLVDGLAAVPSVVFGLWGVLVVADQLRRPYEDVSSSLAGLPLLGPLFGGPVNGRSFLTAGLILAVMITPIVSSITREVFATVPAGQREAALALGATRWEMIRGAVLPHGRAGLVGAVMLGLGRAMGETIAVALVIGSSPHITAHLFASGDALPSVIANQFGEASGLFRSALMGLGVTLFAMTILVNVVARRITRAGADPRV